MNKEPRQEFQGEDGSQRTRRDSGFRSSRISGFPLMKSIRGCVISHSSGGLSRGVENTSAGDYSVNTHGFFGPTDY
jgi:hypothetical protein